MRVSFKELAILVLGMASQGIANPQATISTTDPGPKNLFAVNINNEKLGPLYVSGPGVAATINSSAPLQSFTINPETLFLLAPLTGSPPASVSFTQDGASCGTSGPLVFVDVDNNPCSRQPNWVVQPNHEVRGAITGLEGFFEVCAGNQVFFSSTGTAGCTTVKFVTQFWTA